MLIENAPERLHSIVGSQLSMNDSMLLIYATIYFYFISKNWQYWIYFAIVYSFVSASLMFCVYESTKYYVSRGRYDEARRTLTKIARHNGKNTVFNGPFA